ncbi:lanthionine synthetase C family protein [Actinomadura miaoliensis]|uniref:Lanthionine synthetase C family protein n=1 Tax=Actinomadura miaoliensis TaxID=430685 RepID=A0ABP7WSI4_9ACTN
MSLDPDAVGRRERAARVVETVAGLLADPARVAAITDAPDNAMELPEGPWTPWNAVALSDGYPAVSLLFAELGAADPARRGTAHEYLAAALASPAPAPQPRLFVGAGSLAFAAHAAAVGFGGYRTLLEKLDEGLVAWIRARARADRDRVLTGRPIGHWDGFDVISGAAGLGRYLLGRHEHAGGAAGEALCEVLTTLVAVAMADDVEVEGVRVPAWWVEHGVTAERVDRGGHLNFGLAHGVCGPLALLACAWRAGVRVDRQDEAMGRIVALLDRWRHADDAGPTWPMAVNLPALRDLDHRFERYREVWCYGAAGIARALYLAGTALGERRWQDEAHAALAGVHALAGGAVRDHTLCHGWAGLLQIFLRMAHDTASDDTAPHDYGAAVDMFAGRILDGFDPDEPFGFRYVHPTSMGKNRPGFLEGAAGIALALHCYATGRPPVTGWDTALLLN